MNSEKGLEHRRVTRCSSNINIETSSDIQSQTQSQHNHRSKEINSIAKILFLGSAKVGKTAIIQRFFQDTFDTRYVPTVEDIHKNTFIINNKLAPIETIDTCGSFHFPAMIRLCITKATAFVLVFSNDDLASFEKTKDLLEEIKSVRSENDNEVILPPIVVVCNKSDLEKSNQIDEKKVMEWLIGNSMKPKQFVYSSAKNNESIRSIFESLWHQNELLKVVEFETFYDKNKLSTSGTHLELQKHGNNNTNNSTNVNSNPCSKPQHDNIEEVKSLSRFRASFRLSRKSSQKHRKKEEYTKFECPVS